MDFKKTKNQNYIDKRKIKNKIPTIIERQESINDSFLEEDKSSFKDNEITNQNINILKTTSNLNIKPIKEVRQRPIISKNSNKSNMRKSNIDSSSKNEGNEKRTTKRQIKIRNILDLNMKINEVEEEKKQRTTMKLVGAGRQSKKKFCTRKEEKGIIKKEKFSVIEGDKDNTLGIDLGTLVSKLEIKDRRKLNNSNDSSLFDNDNTSEDNIIQKDLSIKEEDEEESIDDMSIKIKIKLSFLYLSKYHDTIRSHLISFHSIIKHFSNEKKEYFLEKSDIGLILKQIKHDGSYLNEDEYEIFISNVYERLTITKKGSKAEFLKVLFDGKIEKNLFSIENIRMLNSNDDNKQMNINIFIYILVTKLFNYEEIDDECEDLFSYADTSLKVIYNEYFYKNVYENLKEDRLSSDKEPKNNLYSYNLLIHKEKISDFEKKIELLRERVISFSKDYYITSSGFIVNSIIYQIFDSIINLQLTKLKPRLYERRNAVKSENANDNKERIFKSIKKLSQFELPIGNSNNTQVLFKKTMKREEIYNSNDLYNIFSYLIFKKFLIVLSEVMYRKEDFSLFGFESKKINLLLLLFNQMEKSEKVKKSLKNRIIINLNEDYKNQINNQHQDLFFNKDHNEYGMNKKNTNIKSIQVSSRSDKTHIHQFNYISNHYENDFWNIVFLKEMNDEKVINVISSNLSLFKNLFFYFSNKTEKNSLNFYMSVGCFIDFLNKVGFFHIQIENKYENMSYIGHVLYKSLCGKNENINIFNIDLFIQSIYLISLKIYTKDNHYDAFSLFISNELVLLFNKIKAKMNFKYEELNVLLTNTRLIQIINSIDGFLNCYFELFMIVDVDSNKQRTISFDGLKSFLISFEIYPNLISFLQMKYIFIYVIDKISKFVYVYFLINLHVIIYIELYDDNLGSHSIYTYKKFITLIKNNLINYKLFKDILILCSFFIDFSKKNTTSLSYEERLIYLIEKLFNSKSKESLLEKIGKRFDEYEYENIKNNLRKDYIDIYRKMFIEK